MKRILIEVSPGELIDRITILQLKVRHVQDAETKARLQQRLGALVAIRGQLASSPELATLTEQLAALNARLWQIEDELRLCEREEDFGKAFVELARVVYKTNDHRAELRRQINQLLGLAAREEKIYAARS